jgi:hypothetical protein
MDEAVSNLKKGWFKNVQWAYYDEHGFKRYAKGIYFICDGGYLRWPVLICPFKHESCSTQKGCFSSKLESVRKDVECAFGILKKRWRILEYGIRFPDINVVEKVFNVCCILHNMMVKDLETAESTLRVGRGAPIPGDAIWLRDVADEPPPSDSLAVVQWMERRLALAKHVEYMQKVSKKRSS